MIFASLYWLIQLTLPDGTLYLRKNEQSYVWTPNRVEATEYQNYDQALKDRFRLLGRGQRYDIKNYDKPEPTVSPASPQALPQRAPALTPGTALSSAGR